MKTCIGGAVRTVVFACRFEGFIAWCRLIRAHVRFANALSVVNKDKIAIKTVQYRPTAQVPAIKEHNLTRRNSCPKVCCHCKNMLTVISTLFLLGCVLGVDCDPAAIPYCASCSGSNQSQCEQCSSGYLPDNLTNIQDCIYNPGFVLQCATLDRINPMKCLSCQAGYRPDNPKHITSCMNGGSIAGVVIVFLITFCYIVVLVIGYLSDRKYRKAHKQ